MKTRHFIRMLSFGLLGCAATCSLAQQFSQGDAPDCGAPVPEVRRAYFPKVGIGAAYGSHYPCYKISDGSIAECLDRFGNPVPGVQQDAKNNEMESSVPLDLEQMQLAGFKTVRAYDDPAKVWMAMINSVRKNQVNSLDVVYQVTTCKSDAALPGHPCINVKFKNFQQVLDFSIVQLRQVIQQVTPAVFQKAVKLIIVGNEDLVISPTDHKTYNTADLIGAINATKAELMSDGIVVNDGSGNGVDLSSATVIGQMTTPPGEQLAAAYTPGAPVIENIYGAQFSFIKTPAEAVTFLKAEVNKMQAHYASNPAMVGETGWWTAGQDGGYDASTRVGTLADAKAYYQDLYPYLTACSVPTLIFEAYDQRLKGPTDPNKPNPPGTLEAEQYYGVMTPFNVAKDKALLPAPSPAYKDHPETARAALFTFVLARDVVNAPAMSFGIEQPGQTSQTRITMQPFAEVINTSGGTVPVWPTFNLYAPAKGVGGSQMFLYRSATDNKAQCSNTVEFVYSTSQVDPINPTRYVPPFSGGIWKFKDVTAPGCTTQPTDVNWGHGSKAAYAQNVFLNANFSTN